MSNHITNTLPQLLAERAKSEPTRVALRQKERGIWKPLTWADYAAEARAVACGLIAAGLKAGDHVAILSENRKEWVIAEMGIGMARAVTVGVYSTSPAEEVGYVIAHADCRFVICEDQEQADKLLDVKDRLGAVERVFVIDERGLRAYNEPWLESYEALREEGAAKDRAEPGLIDANLAAQTLDDVALMVYTSGSTGKPKGALITWGNITAAANMTITVTGMSARDSCVSYLPLCHVAEQLISVCVGVGAGATVNFGESLRTVQRDVIEIAPTIFLGVPRIWEKLQSGALVKLDEAGGIRKFLFEAGMRACAPFRDKPHSARTLVEKLTFWFFYWLVFRALQNHLGLRRGHVMLSGAAPIAPEVLGFFRTIGLPVREAFGMTETTAAGFVQIPDDFKPGTVGPPAPGIEMDIAPDGELLIRGDVVFKGYYKNPEATDEALHGGWLHTGDLAELVDGQVRIIGRKKEVIITAGGKNLSPSELENNLKISPYIKEAIVVGDRRAYLTALIQIDQDTVAAWAERNDILFTNFKSLAENDDVRRLIEDAVTAANARVASVAQVKKFSLLVKELDHDDDEMTATQKIRRSRIHEKYQTAIEALY